MVLTSNRKSSGGIIIKFRAAVLYKATPFSTPTVLSWGHSGVTQGYNYKKWVPEGISKLAWWCYTKGQCLCPCSLLFFCCVHSYAFSFFQKNMRYILSSAIGASTKNPQNGSFGIKVCQIMPIHPDKPIQMFWRCWNWFQAPLVKVSLKNKNL
jgi:hypothetical protein